MKALISISLLASVLLVGCGNGGSGSSGTSSGNPVTAPADYLGSITKAQQNAVKTVDVAALTQAIQMFQAEQGRLPKDLNELVTMKYMAKIPTPPAGKKITYDTNSGAVKIVAQ
jgi:hypothetical protein